MSLAYFIFFVSGAAALSYQIVWQRLLVLFSGSDIRSATIIVAAFMTGLGLGSLAGGHLADRLTRVASLLAFAAAELAIAAFGAFSATLYYDVLYQQFGQLAWGLEARAAVLFVSLLWPTFFMGVSLPLLARSLTTDIRRAAIVTGALYGWNTVGAAIGALATTWWLLPRLGLDGSLDVTAALNLIAAAMVVPLAVILRRPDAGSESRPDEERTASSDLRVDDTRTRLGVWMIAYGLAGFLGLSLEIVWFRLMGVMLKSTAFTFGTLLAVYLTGLGAGAAVATLLVRRIRRPVLAFVRMQAAVGIYAGLSRRFRTC